MPKTTFTVISALSFLAVPSLAQETDGAMPDGAAAETMALTTEQQLAYDGWPPENRAAHDAWPAEAKSYFWTLTPERQMLFFRLSDNDKLSLVGMDEASREAAWQVVEKQVAAQQTAPAPDAAPMTDAAPAPEGEPMPEGPATPAEMPEPR